MSSTPNFDLDLAIDELYGDIVRVNSGNGWRTTVPEDWDDNYKVLAFLMLAVTEIAEAAEAFRKNNKEEFIKEIADVFIRLIETAEGLGFKSLGQEIVEKIMYNATRSYKHGGKRV